jgi:hypothetical protein
MNILSREEQDTLRAAWQRGLGVRAAAREARVNRETAGRYFRAWSVSSDPAERVRDLRLIADVEEWLMKFPTERASYLRDAFYEGLAQKRAQAQS